MNDLALLLDLYGNSEVTKLLICVVIFCLVFTASAKWRVELRAKIGQYRNRSFIHSIGPCMQHIRRTSYIHYTVGWFVVVITSHSAIFQPNSDRTVVQFPNLDPLPGTHHGQLGVLSLQSLPQHGHWDVQRCL